MSHYLIYHELVRIAFTMDILKDIIQENAVSLIATSACWLSYYISSKILQSFQNDLNHIQYAPRIRDFTQLSDKWDSDFPYAVVEGKVYPNSAPINSLYDKHTKGVVRDLKTWQLRKIWNVISRTWDMSTSLHASYESNVPMHLVDQNNAKMYVQDFPDCKQYKLLQLVSNFTEPNDDPMLKKILENILQNEVVVGYKRVEKMLKIGSTALFCGKITKEFDGLKVVFRVTKPQSPFTYQCTALSYGEFLEMKKLNVSLLEIITVSLGIGLGFMVIYCIFRYFAIGWEKYNEQREAGELRLEMTALELTEPIYTEPELGNLSPHQISVVCSVCYERQVKLIVKTCNHACLCFTCAPKVKGRCPICRAPIAKLEKIYFP